MSSILIGITNLIICYGIFGFDIKLSDTEHNVIIFLLLTHFMYADITKTNFNIALFLLITTLPYLVLYPYLVFSIWVFFFLRESLYLRLNTINYIRKLYDKETK